MSEFRTTHGDTLIRVVGGMYTNDIPQFLLRIDFGPDKSSHLTTYEVGQVRDLCDVALRLGALTFNVTITSALHPLSGEGPITISDGPRLEEGLTWLLQIGSNPEATALLTYDEVRTLRELAAQLFRDGEWNSPGGRGYEARRRRTGRTTPPDA